MAPTSSLSSRFIEHEHLRLHVLDWGGDGPPVLLLHPTGFNAGSYAPIAERLTDRFRVLAVDFRGHGGSDAPPDLADCSFAAAGRDVLAVIDGLGLVEPVALGHSMGAAAAVLADAARPGVLGHVLLCEAIAFPAPGTGGDTPALVRPDGSNPLVEGALRRRRAWPDRATALASYASRPPLDRLDPAVLAGYVEWGLREEDEGDGDAAGVVLACAPEVEAACYQSAGAPDGGPAAFAHLGALVGRATVVRGDATDIPGALFDAQAALVGTAAVVASGSHFFVQEDVEQTVELVRIHLG